MIDQDIKNLQDRIIALEQQSLGVNPAIHPITQQNLKYQIGLVGATGVEGRSHLGTTQSIPINSGGSPQKINFDTNDFVSGITWDGTNHRFTCLTAGKYLVSLTVAYKVSQIQDGVAYGALIYKNGSSDSEAYSEAGGTGNELAPSIMDIVSLSVSDYIEGYAYTSSNATIDIQALSSRTNLSIAKV